MSFPTIQTSFAAGEIAPALFGHVDFAKYSIGASTMRNMFVAYKGGSYSRAGFAYVGYSKQSQLIRAQGSIFFPANPTAAATVTLNGVVWTFIAGSTSGTNIHIAGTCAATIGNLRVALNASVNPSINVATYSNSGGPATATLTISYDTAGEVGNTYTLAASAAVPSGATLTGGSGGSSVGPRLVPFQFSSNQGLMLEFGERYMRVISQGAYVVETAGFVVTNATQANPCVLSLNTTAGLANGEWLFLSDIDGMTELDNRSVVITILNATDVALSDVFGDNIDSTAFTAYTGGGAANLVYTLDTPYAAADLAYLKFTQSADVMSLTLRNQETGTEYQPYDLARLADDNWTLTTLTTGSSISAPTSLTVTANQGSSSDLTNYQYAVTAVDMDTGEESVASLIASASTVDIASTAGSLSLAWNGVAGAKYYNIYKAPPAFQSDVPVGSLFGFAGSTFGTSFVDSNIIQDMSQVPPLHLNPFARGRLLGVDITSAGGPAMTSCTFVITTATGSGAVGYCVVANGALTAFVFTDPGKDYEPADTITFTPDAGAVPTGTLMVGPQTGTYPSVVGYFQQRRIYGNTANQPDTYWMSQPGAYTNYDSRIPTIDTDAIVGTPWSVQVDGIQFFAPVLGGLVTLTGQAAYSVTGAGGSTAAPAPITPGSQQAIPQVFNGSHPHVAPVRVDYDVYYLQSKGSVVRNLSYNFWVSVLTGVDVTFLSSHLFLGYQIASMTWCEEPFKLLWAVRNDGVMLSLTSMKTQDVMAWARHDTNGAFICCASITEPPVDALYVAVQRYFPNGRRPFMIERMDNRLWNSIEECWCVDSALTYPKPTRNAEITVSSAVGLGQPVNFADLVGGTNYSPGTLVTVNDPTGAGCTVRPTITSGVITGLTFTGGTGYTSPTLIATDPTNKGRGFSATVVLDNSATFTASASVFTIDDVGSVIRAGNGVAQVTAYVSGVEVTAQISTPIVGEIPNSGGMLAPIGAGGWTITVPITKVTGLNHLVGLEVTGLADGNVIPPQVVAADGTITLATPASSIIVGLGFQCQLQSLYMEGGGAHTDQGMRKQNPAVTIRLEASATPTVGANQPDGSTFLPKIIQTTWTKMTSAPTNAAGLATPPYGSAEILNTDVVRPSALFTGDVRAYITSGFVKKGQVAVQQLSPTPLQVLAMIRETEMGDSPETTPKPKGMAA